MMRAKIMVKWETLPPTVASSATSRKVVIQEQRAGEGSS